MDEVKSPFQRRGRNAFSLIELLVVLAIVAIVAALAVPSLSSTLTASKLNSASQIVSDSIGQARQEAVTKDRDVQVRFYKITSGSVTGWRALQVVRVEQTASGSTLVPVTKVKLLPDGIIISPSATLSTVLTADSTITGSVNLPNYGATSYSGFYFLPSGSIENALNSANNFLTLQSATASGTPPKDYSTLQINPVTGKVIVYRP